MNNFNQLISNIESVHGQLQSSAAHAVNQSLTIRNWLIGYYIYEFEQKGEDRAKYGDALLKTLSEKLDHIKGTDERSLRRFRQFYLSYPQIHTTLKDLWLSKSIRGSLSPVLKDQQIRGTLPPEFKEGKILLLFLSLYLSIVNVRFLIFNLQFLFQNKFQINAY